MAAHLFIFYFAILSAITPPVCTGVYVAAGIARADPIDTGFTALRLGLIVFLLPFAFVYEPALLLIGGPGAIALHASACILGIGCWAYGLVGWWRRDLDAIPRALLLAGGVMLVWPSLYVSLAGSACGATALGMAEFAVRRTSTPTVVG